MCLRLMRRVITHLSQNANRGCPPLLFGQPPAEHVEEPMPKSRRHHGAEFKFKVAPEAAKGLKTINLSFQ